MRSELGALHLAAVVVGPMYGQARAVALLSRLIGRPPVPDRGVLLWVGRI